MLDYVSYSLDREIHPFPRRFAYIYVYRTMTAAAVRLLIIYTFFRVHRHEKDFVSGTTKILAGPKLLNTIYLDIMYCIINRLSVAHIDHIDFLVFFF